MKIVLDAAEERIRTLLLQFAREYARRGNAAVTLRFTGGWVRDKLLGRASHDIDVAIDKTTGEEFATALHSYLVDLGSDAGGVHKIASNPEKSKHLETATTRICGLDIDFVNLRSEEYADAASRVPTAVKFGTPQEDALRRDATLNALFYNLTTQTVEDFTGHGLDDLEHGVLRTPLEPHVTFSDDPLRVLRLVRFAGQLGFSIAPETRAAMSGDLVGALLRQKVSGERVGTEIQKLVEAPHAVEGLRYIAQLGLGPHIFALPTTVPHASPMPDPELGQRVETGTAVLQQLPGELLPQTPEQQGVLWLAIVLQPWRGIQVPTGKANKTEDAVGLIVKESLRLTKTTKDGVSKLHASVSVIDNVIAAHANGTEVPRHVLGNFVRAAGPLWRLSLAYNAVRTDSPASLAAVAEQIVELGLDDAHSVKPLIDGKQATALLGRKPGPWLQPVLAAAMDYQFDHPDATAEDLQAFVRTIENQ